MTRTCGLLFIVLAVIALILSIADTAPEAIAAGQQVREGNNPMPIATSVK